ncbi:hypothetical protein B0T24DRAFT_128400 [Lasiosphaeria ovina]|uniref:Uncharacterized protein n=1 Tax=Lasiosphaeria ovina TaxID=92902 RepID=A0AAE0JSQ7_9PEZI|nr:hypothetical protein B0T24DRAFT_128400 [Lasiosphaeria ovina]
MTTASALFFTCSSLHFSAGSERKHDQPHADERLWSQSVEAVGVGGVGQASQIGMPSGVADFCSQWFAVAVSGTTCDREGSSHPPLHQWDVVRLGAWASTLNGCRSPLGCPTSAELESRPHSPPTSHLPPVHDFTHAPTTTAAAVGRPSHGRGRRSFSMAPQACQSVGFSEHDRGGGRANACRHVSVLAMHQTNDGNARPERSLNLRRLFLLTRPPLPSPCRCIHPTCSPTHALTREHWHLHTGRHAQRMSPSPSTPDTRL